MAGEVVTVSVGGRNLKLSNLDKVLYPEAGFTKGEVIDYYVAVSGALLPHLAGRPVTLRRYPDGVDAESFFAKNIPGHAPDWVRRVELPSSHSARGVTEYVMVEDLPTLVWTANLAGLELHVPQWRIDDDDVAEPPDLLVFDLDPGPSTTVVECCLVAELIREVLDEDGLVGHPKTSGAKGLQLYAPVVATGGRTTSEYAKAVAERLAREHPDTITATMARRERPGKVFIDWSQNNPAKTTVAPYSLRARPHPTVSTPVGWDEVADCRSPDDLRFTAADVRERLAEDGDLLDGLHADPVPLPG